MMFLKQRDSPCFASAFFVLNSNSLVWISHLIRRIRPGRKHWSVCVLYTAYQTVEHNCTTGFFSFFKLFFFPVLQFDAVSCSVLCFICHVVLWNGNVFLWHMQTSLSRDWDTFQSSTSPWNLQRMDQVQYKEPKTQKKKKKTMLSFNTVHFHPNLKAKIPTNRGYIKSTIKVQLPLKAKVQQGPPFISIWLSTV